MVITRSLGMLLLGIYLVLTGLAAFIPLVGSLGLLLAVLALLAGILILIGR
ncbi:MAG: hypothetical protein ACRD1R_05155 [Acidobacteriota bacterium]